jgi:hypothetical protein
MQRVLHCKAESEHSGIDVDLLSAAGVGDCNFVAPSLEQWQAFFDFYGGVA